MRLTIAAALLAVAATPVLAQSDGALEPRVGKLEKEMRAVQRKVFPGGVVEPQVTAPTPAPAEDVGAPASAPIVDLTERVSSLEQELARMTGQVEQDGFRIKQLEDQVTKLREDSDTRLRALEGGAAAGAAAGAAPAAKPADAAPPAAADDGAAAAPAAGASTGDAGEDAYMAAYKLWAAKRFPEAEAALKDYVAKYPKHRRASFAQNLLGRTYLDSGKPAAAATAFLANYNKNPRGERAPDSLYYLGQSLMKLKPPQPSKACDAYSELLRAYGETIAQPLRDRVTKAQADAKCSTDQ